MNFEIGQTFEADSPDGPFVEHVYENPDPNAKPLQPGDEGYIDADEVEKKLVQQELDRMNKDPDQEEVACMVIKMFTPRFDQLIEGLSNRALKRVVKSLMAYPIGKEYKHPTAAENEAFKVGLSIQDAKMVLAIKTYHDHADTIIAGAAQAAMEKATLSYGDEAIKVMENNPENKGT